MQIVRLAVVVSVVLVFGSSATVLAQDRGGRERVVGFVTGIVAPWPPSPGLPYDGAVYEAPARAAMSSHRRFRA